MAPTETIDLDSEYTWVPPTPSVRGTVVLLPGRGESAAVYERFGSRIAYDGYVVRALVGRSADEQRAALELSAPGPVVLVGSDTGALEALRLATRSRGLIAGAVLVGTPSGAAVGPRGWDDELDARSGCPVHRERLAAGVERGSLAGRPVPHDLVRVLDDCRPVLIVHGDADTVAPVDGALALAEQLPAAETAVVLGGRHDALNDVSHRSVAAAVVQFLERLRGSATAAPVIATDTRVPAQA